MIINLVSAAGRLAIEYGKVGIRVNGICPTYAETSLTRDFFDDRDFDQTFTDYIPLRRWGEVADVASLAVTAVIRYRSVAHDVTASSKTTTLSAQRGASGKEPRPKKTSRATTRPGGVRNSAQPASSADGIQRATSALRNARRLRNLRRNHRPS